MSRHVFLGVADWDRPEWLGTFYPSGLPDEWRLAYYCTQYPCTWLSYGLWSGLTPDQAKRWVAESPEWFRFVLQSPGSPAAGDAALQAVFQPRLGLVCAAEDPALLWFDATTDLRSLATDLRQRTDLPGDGYLISRDGNLDRLEQVNNLVQLLGL